ncbi:MAG: glyoxalase/bleomycin resistance/extradiol dioxygenase family protein [Chloroflexi bacterium]|nr:glyoxalase/bleomycin resistance/extradiol dioxygenase family protein [Chloroflexota bacterium]
MAPNRSIFVNLAVKDVDKSVAFFTELGFEFNPAFTNDQGACLIISENILVMLLAERFFGSFIPGRRIADTSDTTEALLAVFLAEREKVDAMLDKAVEAGGTAFRERSEFQGMYGGAFQDLDGHIWEIGHMGQAAAADVPQSPEDRP